MTKQIFYHILLLAIFLPGCAQRDTVPTVDPSTAIAAAVAVQMASLPTQTPAPSSTPQLPSPTPPKSPTVTVIPPTGTATHTRGDPYPYITWTPSTCDRSAFIADMDIVDYSKVAPGTNFTKTWRIKNIGTCPWTQEYRFTYISGTPMGADTIYLPRAVAPGETIDLSLVMKAPDMEENYSNFWRLRNTAGEIFGTTFYVAVEVSQDAPGLIPAVTQVPPASTPAE